MEKLKTLQSQVGLWLTQRELANENDRIFTTEVALGKNTSPLKYMEVDNAYKEAWEDKYLPKFPEE